MSLPRQRGGREAADDDFTRALADDDPVELYEQAPVGYLSTSPDGVVLKANQTFWTWTGYRPEDVVGTRRFADLLSPGGKIYHDTHVGPLLRMQRQVREIALDLVLADERRLPVLVNAVMETDDVGKPRVVRIAVFDATERRGYERVLLEAKRRAEHSEAHASSLARTLQQTFIPPLPPAVEGLQVGAAYRPAGDGSEVGGDFYDVFPIGTDDWVVVVGDVCGKGAEAAVVTALVRHTIRIIAVHHAGPAQVLREVNDVLVRHAPDRFATVALLRLQRTEGEWWATVALGGHPRPVLTAVGGGEPRWVGVPGRLLGVLDEVEVAELRQRVAPGEALVLYTDGVTEGRADGDMYGEERLLAALRHETDDAQQVAETIVADVLGFQGGSARDDIAVVVLAVPPSAPR